MSEAEDTYCRLCAEPTPLEQLISCDDDVGQNSKITSKMLWINIDISNTQVLPKTICFSCFDLLERAWKFLHNVRTAQAKLNQIYCVKIDLEDVENIGRPVDKDWEKFCDPKPEVKSEPKANYSVSVTDSLLKEIKYEPCDSDHEGVDFHDSLGSSDSDRPLKRSSKKKKVKSKRKLKKKYDKEILNEELLPNSTAEVIQLDMSLYTMTWEDYTWCCANCDAQCKTVDLLRLHSQQIHHCCPSFKCSDCGKAISTYKSFVTHIRLHYKSLRRNCDMCNKYFKWSAVLKRHRNMAHREAYIHSCRNCGASFETEDLLQQHLILFAKSYKKQQVLKQEKLDTDMKCDVCNREFKSRSNLQAHRQTHMERSRDFSCHMCGKMFYTKGALSTHMATHEDNKPFKCQFCPMAFRARGNLTSHISLHSGAKPFVCEQCGKSFRVKRHLKSHSIVHTDLMPYICEYCNKSFRFKTRLNLHVRQHTGAKPYTCIYCHRDFTNGSNYKKHMQRRHNIDTSVRKKIYNSLPNNAVVNLENSENNGNNIDTQSTTVIS